MTTSIVPSFSDNRETSSILASDSIRMMEEIPDTQKFYQLQASSSLTENGCTIQSTNLNDWIAGELEVVATRSFTFTGKTATPSADAGSEMYGTQPYLWNSRNSTVDPFCINKSIRELKISVANKNFSNPDRLPEMTDIYQSQFDIDVLKSYGINGDGVKEKTIEHNHYLAAGSTCDGLASLLFDYGSEITNALGIFAQSGFMKNNIISEYTENNFPWKQNNKGYCVVKSVKFYKDSLSTPLGTSYSTLGFEGMAVPTVNADGTGDIYYSVRTGFNETLIQVVELEIHEYIIDPNFSNPYSKNKNLKTYYVAGYPFNLQFVFNQDYMQSILRWTPNQRGLATGGTAPTNLPMSSAPVLTSSKWVDFAVGFWTFNTAKPLPTNPIKTIYYKENRQSVVSRPLTFNALGHKSSKTGSVSISTSNLSSLPPYIIVYGAVTPSSNPNYFSSGSPSTNIRTNTPYIEMANIDNITLRIGTQADALGGIELNKEQLVNHTLGVLGNLEYRQMLMSDLSYMNYNDFGQTTFTVTTTIGTPDITGEITKANYEAVAPVNAYQRGWNFYIIDVAKLNIRNDGVPILPSVNYGSQSFKSLTIIAEFSMTRNMWEVLSPLEGTARNLTCEMNVVLLDKYVRTLPLMSGNMTDDPIEYNLSDVSPALMAQIQSPYSGDGDSQLSYVGGSFLGSLMGHINRIRSHPLVKTISKIAHTVHNVANAVSGSGKPNPYSRA